MGLTVTVHVIAGGLGIIFGFVALSAAKGATLHRKSGMLLVFAMITMGLMGAMMSAVRGVAPASNVPMGLMTAYWLWRVRSRPGFRNVVRVSAPLETNRSWEVKNPI